ncbi:hypothetical protein MMC14_009881 [Varicellaria rhodocarpa]|nr:hypothetical protein [Varicellaria rhodocarpa]
MLSNVAAWQPEPATKLEIKPTPYTTPNENEVVIKNHALAVNPIDWKLQDNALFPWLKYPLLLGADVAGEVVEVGSAVTRFKIGDRLLGQAVGMTTGDSPRAGFQQYTIVLENLAAHIPSSLAYPSAAVIPLGLGTAACGLFQQDQLALQHPSVPPKSTGKTLLIWGGASSVGCNGIQLAVSAGYDVIATASPKNFDYLKKLGASQVLDYNSKDLIQELVAVFIDKPFAGALHTIGDIDACFEVVDKLNGNKFLSTTSPLPQKKPSGVKSNRIFGTTLKDNEVGKAVYEDFLGKALAEGAYVAAPEPWIIGTGLDSLQSGLETQKKGVSLRKVVITL